MKLNDITDSLQRRLSQPLPGAAAHDLMRAMPAGGPTPKFEHTLAPRPGGVLILLYEQDDDVRFPLIRRAEYVGAHSGQISLPGGKSEAGEDQIAAALREAEEEIGIARTLPIVLGTLSSFLVIPSNFMITPVIAVLHSAPVFMLDPYEVAGILSGSVNALVKDNAILEKEIIAAGQFRMNAPHFDIDGAVVWGATAMMLNEFRSVLKEALRK